MSLFKCLFYIYHNLKLCGISLQAQYSWQCRALSTLDRSIPLLYSNYCTLTSFRLLLQPQHCLPAYLMHDIYLQTCRIENLLQCEKKSITWVPAFHSHPVSSGFPPPPFVHETAAIFIPSQERKLIHFKCYKPFEKLSTLLPITKKIKKILNETCCEIGACEDETFGGTLCGILALFIWNHHQQMSWAAYILQQKPNRET